MINCEAWDFALKYRNLCYFLFNKILIEKIDKYSAVDKDDLVQSSILMLFEGYKKYRNRPLGYIGAVIKSYMFWYLLEYGFRSVKIPHHAIYAIKSCGKTGFASLAAKEILNNEVHTIHLDNKDDAEAVGVFKDLQFKDGCEENQEADIGTNKLLDLLDPITRKIIMLKYFEGRTRKEISQELGVNLDFSRNRIQKGLNVMRSGKSCHRTYKTKNTIKLKH